MADIERRTHRAGLRHPKADAVDDPNLAIAGLLFDLAHVQTREGSRAGYQRAARTLVTLSEPITTFVHRPAPRRIPHVGPSTLRVIAEYLAEGRSETVERAVASSGRAPEIQRMRELRRNFLSRAAVNQILEGRTARGVVSLKDYRGDFQMHSTFSDGTLSIAELVEASRARGWTRMLLTDHSHGLSIARGVSMDELRIQHAEIDRLNRRHRGHFRILKGIETNILADGSVDMTREELRQLDLVVASPHSGLRSSADQTARMVAAVRQRGIHILGHPQGRKYGRRAGIRADWPAVFTAAAAAGTAIEIDGSWDRQDVDHELARQAVEAGCVIALDSDAHHEHEHAYAEIAIAHARLARIPASRVINCWIDDRLTTWSMKAWTR
jgi:histidinol phosphatase-like PHP family hydrolase